MHVYPINLNKLALKWILDLFWHFLQQPKIILMQDWILSDASVNSRDFCSKEESLLGDGNSVLELCFLWPVWTLDFGLLWKWEWRAITWNRMTAESTEVWERSNADQMLFYSTDYFKILHWALVSPAIPRLEVFLTCWKCELQVLEAQVRRIACPSLKDFISRVSDCWAEWGRGMVWRLLRRMCFL